MFLGLPLLKYKFVIFYISSLLPLKSSNSLHGILYADFYAVNFSIDNLNYKCYIKILKMMAIFNDIPVSNS